MLAYLKLTPLWKPLETQTAEKFLKRTMGDNAWKIIWEPLFEGKFSSYASKIPASWFWARIKKRSTTLGYPSGGFSLFIDKLCISIKAMGGRIVFNSIVDAIVKKGNIFQLTSEGKVYEFDKIICTLPSQLFLEITKNLPKVYIKTLAHLKSLAALTLVLRLKHQFLVDDTYWLNINDRNFPFLAVVEHTNFMERKFYGGETILYVGNYLPQDNPLLSMSKEKLTEHYLPSLIKINGNFSKEEIITTSVYKENFAQPIIPLNYSDNIPPMKTPIDGLYLANMQQVYPWDRGTNYAVELGEKVAKLILKEK